MRIWHVILAGLALAGAASAQAGEAPSVTQYAITWVFDKPHTVGQFVTGDWWVVGPVTVRSVEPAPESGRSGSVVNPAAGRKQGYDDRIAGFDAGLRAELPLELKPGQSLVSTHSLAKVGDRTAETVAGQYARGPLRTAVVLTCLAKAPPADAFRPPFVGAAKPVFTLSQIRRDLLPRLARPPTMPDRKSLERNLQRIWLDHLADWVCRAMHPLENMPDYGRELTTITSQTGLLLLVDDPKGENETLLARFVQLGIDLSAMARSYDRCWPANGGHCSGRKWPILFAGLMLDDANMVGVNAAFAEDEQTYYGDGYGGQKALWQIHPGLQHEHLPPERWKGPPFKGDNDGEKSDAYRRLNGPTWVGQALAARLMGARKNWNHNAFFDYVDRWWKEEVEAGQGDAKKSTAAAGGPFVEAMWKTYRQKADEIGAAVAAKRPRTAAILSQPAATM
jgi:hypothetical protein